MRFHLDEALDNANYSTVSESRLLVPEGGVKDGVGAGRRKAKAAPPCQDGHVQVGVVMLPLVHTR